MLNLLKADFYRLLKSKSIYVLLILSVVLCIFSLGVNFVVNLVTKELDIDAEMPLVISGKAVMFSGFALTNNTGLLITIFSGIITITDVRHGTIRNKVLFGENRTKIYLSHFIVSLTMCVVMSLLSFAVLAIGSSILFGYGEAFNGLEFFKSLLIGILSFVLVASISTFLALITKSMPLTIILTIVVCLGLMLICSISLMLPTNKYNFLFYVVPTYGTMLVSQGIDLSLKVFLTGLCSLIFFIGLNTICGIILFNKIDLK
jgi:ABC-2 type transport system permease protein